MLAEVVGAARGVVADLGDGGHVDRVVQLSVPARVQPVSRLRSRRCFDRGRPVVPSEVPGGREPADVTDSADDDRRHQRPDPEHLGDGRLRRLNRRDVASADLNTRCVESADLVEQLPWVTIRSIVIGPSACKLARSSSARATVNDRPVPPSISRHSRACNRQIERVRWAVI